MKDMYHWEWSLRFQKLMPGPGGVTLPLMPTDQDVTPSATAPVPCLSVLTMKITTNSLKG